MKGMALGLPYDGCARMGSVAATYALEHLGGQSHAYTWHEFAADTRSTSACLRTTINAAAR